MPNHELILSDTHAHLESYTPEVLDDLITRAQEKGIRYIIANGITLRSSAQSVEIARRYPFIWATVGLHPFYAVRLRKAVGDVRKLAGNERVVAIGEIGLDFRRFPDTGEAQIPLFVEQLELACELDLPVVIHTKSAHRETMEAIRMSGIPGEQVIMQGFRDDVSILEDWLKLGFYLSIGPTIVTEPTEALTETIRQIPSENLLLETDAVARRTLSQGLELATLRSIAEKVAEIRKVSLEDLARLTTANLMKIFRLAPVPPRSLPEKEKGKGDRLLFEVLACPG